MKCNYTILAFFLFVSVLTLQQCCDATPAVERDARQTKLSNNSGVPQAEVKALDSQALGVGLSANQLQALTGFTGVINSIPYAHYGGLAYGGSAYPGNPGMGLAGAPFGGPTRIVNSATPGVSIPQLGNLASLNYPPTANYVGNNLPAYQLNGPDAFPNYLFGGSPQMQNSFGPTVAGANNLESLVNMANLPGLTGSGNSVFGSQIQPTQLQLQGQASQPRPQLGGAYPYPPPLLGQMGGYGQGFQAYQVL